MSKKVENFIKEEVGKIKDKAPSVKSVDKKGVKPGLHSFSKYC